MVADWGWTYSLENPRHVVVSICGASGRTGKFHVVVTDLESGIPLKLFCVGSIDAMKDLENAYTDSLSAVMASYSTAFITTCLLD